VAARTSRPTSALAALTAPEKAVVLDDLLAGRPDLRQLAEARAARLLSSEDRSAVAAAVGNALLSRDIVELNGRAGYQPGRGYVHPGEAATEILDEDLESFLHDLERRATLGTGSAAVELAVGILCGLYECRDADSETLLEYSPDYPPERAADVLDLCRKLGVTLPVVELIELLPEWSAVLERHASEIQDLPPHQGESPSR
jgi:hypothetical protein